MSAARSRGAIVGIGELKPTRRTYWRTTLEMIADPDDRAA